MTFLNRLIRIGRLKTGVERLRQQIDGRVTVRAGGNDIRDMIAYRLHDHHLHHECIDCGKPVEECLYQNFNRQGSPQLYCSCTSSLIRPAHCARSSPRP